MAAGIGEGIWYVVTSPRSTFVIQAVRGKVVYGAPISKKSWGRPVADVIRYYRTRWGATVTRLD